MDNVQQVALEFHEVTHPRLLPQYVAITQSLYGLGYKTIAWDPNLTTNPKGEAFRYFEVVFRKADLCIMEAK